MHISHRDFSLWSRVFFQEEWSSRLSKVKFSIRTTLHFRLIRNLINAIENSCEKDRSKYASEKYVDQTGATSRTIVGNLLIERRIDVVISIFHDQL